MKINLTIEEFSMLREAMYSCKQANLKKNPSAFQAKLYFQNEANFEKIMDKLRLYLTLNKSM